jgi:small conductance mechanosensitive channel
MTSLPPLSVVNTILIGFLLKLIGGVALWFVGTWIIKIALKLVRRALAGSNLDTTVRSYLISVIALVLRVVLIVAILGFFGIQTASFAALLAGAGVAIGAAWSGLLSNFAAGVFLQLFRPFAVGQSISAAGVSGTVEEIGMFVTTIESRDNVRHIVPNSKLLGDTILNYSILPYRRVDLVAQLDNSTDVIAIISLLKDALRAIPNQFEGKSPDVEILEFNESGPRLTVRLYSHNRHYSQIYFDTNRVILDVLKRSR